VNEKVELDFSTANQKLLASFANLHWPTLPEDKIERLINFTQKALTSVKFYQLNFVKDLTVWNLLDP
jgi:hypothetical protein